MSSILGDIRLDIDDDDAPDAAAFDGDGGRTQCSSRRSHSAPWEVDSVDESGSTALRYAAWEGKTDIVALLLDSHANPDKVLPKPFLALPQPEKGALRYTLKFTCRLISQLSPTL